MEESIEDWIKRVEKAKKMLEELEPKDRLDLAAAIDECNTAINSSTLGWSTWTKTPGIMKKFTDAELKEIFEIFRKFAIEFMELDLKWTKAIAKKPVPKKEKEDESKKRTGYVS